MLVNKAMPQKTESEILAKCLADMREKCVKHLAKMFFDFRPSIPGIVAAKNFTKNSRLIPRVMKHFSTTRLWELGGPNKAPGITGGWGWGGVAGFFGGVSGGSSVQSHPSMGWMALQQQQQQ